MEKGLAVETSGRIGSIAVCDGGQALRAAQFPHGLRNAAEIIPIIDGLCCEQGWKPRDIRHLYVSAGPGSFTGLRIGITLAKVMWLATAAKVVAVPTLRVLAENAPADATRLVVLLDAKRDQIYTARFERRRPEEPWSEVEEAHLDHLPAVLARAGRPVHLLGEGIPCHRKFLPESDSGVILTEPDLWQARAEVVGRIGWEMSQRGEFADALTLTPIYIRPPEAQEKYDALRNQPGTSGGSPRD